MNLYLVTCVSHVAGYIERHEVYALAGDEVNARVKALALMRRLDYKYKDWVENVKLVASTKEYAAQYLLAE